MQNDHIVIHTDGACKGNPGRGGWGAVIEQDGAKPPKEEGREEVKDEVKKEAKKAARNERPRKEAKKSAKPKRERKAKKTDKEKNEPDKPVTGMGDHVPAFLSIPVKL